MSAARCWGRYPAHVNLLQHSHWRGKVAGNLELVLQVQPDTLAHGNGRSYGDSCLSAGRLALGMRTLDRFIHFDAVNGVLIAEAGITLGEILRVIIPAGWFLPVTPGTQHATLGGSIANDVHGKNHHVRGTFGCHVQEFCMLRQGCLITCSATENPELYAATIGGLGLTGIVLWASIRLVPIRSSQIISKVVRFDGLDEFFHLSAELDQQHEYSVAWIDCAAKGSKVGRGVYMVGDHAEYGTCQFSNKSVLTVPCTPPFSLINRWSLKAFNQLYWSMHPAAMREIRTDYTSFFYPLDSIASWNRIYGRKGFQQYQCVIPEEVAQTAINDVLTAIANSGRGSFLAVLKRCGSVTSPGLLSFPMVGTSLALDFPQDKHLEQDLFQRLDDIVHEAGGRLYPAKDAHMRADHFQAAYPAWQQLERLRDPALNSLFWQRVTLCNAY